VATPSNLPGSPLPGGTCRPGSLLPTPLRCFPRFSLQEVVAINQDDLGVAGDLVWVQGKQRVSNAAAAAAAGTVLPAAASAVPC
jgi:hypothetical protein